MRLMIRWGLVVVVVAAACGGKPKPVPLAPGLPRTEPVVRVGIAVDTAAVAIRVEGGFDVATPPGQVLHRVSSGADVTFSADSAGRLSARPAEGPAAGPWEGPVLIRPAGGAHVVINGQAYRGTAMVRPAGKGRVTAVNVVPMEQYLLSVVPLELPSRHVEASRAQAVAARTYAIANLGSRESQGFDVYATVADQVYGGATREDAMGTRAVRDTNGEIVTYQGNPILAYYHSTCGGRTAARDEAWPWHPPLPYLQSVSDQVPGSVFFYCDVSSRFRWSVSLPGDSLKAILTRTLAAQFGASVGTVEKIENVQLAAITPAGRAATVRIDVDGRSYVVRGDSVRWMLRPTPGAILNSALLSAVETDREAGTVRRIEIRGGGWGHGIGMCQWGAIGRARHGQSYREILGAYYRGTEVVKLY